MLNIFYGDMKEAVYNTASYFKYDYEEDWIVDPMVKEMIQDVDKSTVIDSGVIDSPVLGKIPPIGLSGGVKTLILVKFEPEKVFKVAAQNCRAGGTHSEFASPDGFWQKAVYNKSAEYESNRSQYGRTDFGRR